MAGYALAKYRFMGNKLLFNTVMLSRMVPFTTLIPLFYIMSRLGLSNTYAGVIIPSIASTTSVFMMRQYSSQFPTALMEAARIDGANEWVILRKSLYRFYHLRLLLVVYLSLWEVGINIYFH